MTHDDVHVITVLFGWRIDNFEDKRD